MSKDYQNPNKVKNPLSSPAFKKYLGVSMAAIFVIIFFVGFIWISGGRKPGIPDDIVFKQLDAPADGAPIVVFETNMGTVKAVMYPEDAPEYCEYFTGLVNSGYYDGTYFCAVVDSAYALGGTKSASPDEAETEDSDKTAIKAEVSNNLWPIKGAIASYIGTKGVWPTAKNYAGSTFLFVNTIDEAYMNESALKRAYGDSLGAVYSQEGGIPHFSKKYTIFAQIYDGWDIFDSIMASETLEGGQPSNDIIIQKAYISTYSKQN